MPLTVVLPVFRNGPFLEELHGRLQTVMRTCATDYRLIFVNDASPDDSLEILERIARRDQRTLVIDLDRNVGQQKAILMGLSFSRGHWTILLDADLQDPPEAIPDLLVAAQRGEHAALFAGRSGRHTPAGRLLTSRLFKGLLHRLTGVPETAGLFVVIRDDLRRFLLQFPTDLPLVTAMIGLSGLPMGVIPVPRRPRPMGRSAYSGFRRLLLGLGALGLVLVHRLKPHGIPCLERPGALPLFRVIGPGGAEGGRPD